MGNKRYKFSRFAMYNQIESKLKNMKLKPGKAIIIGDSLRGKSKNLNKIQNRAIPDMLPKKCDIIAPPYPDVDIQCMPYEDDTFDYVIADQVLEHVQKPWVATEEVRRVLKTGGLAIMTSCLMQHIHGIPEDYFRFTPDGLKVLCENFSKIEQASGHGSWPFLQKFFGGKIRKPVKPGTPLAKEALKNDEKYLLMVWIIARK